MTLEDIRLAVKSEDLPWTEPTWTGAAWKWVWPRCLRRYEVAGPPRQDAWPDDKYEQEGGVTYLVRPSQESLILRLSPGLAVFDSYSIVPYIVAMQQKAAWAEGDRITLDWILSAWRCALGLTDAMPSNLGCS